MNEKQIKQLAESCGFMEFEQNIFECSVFDLKLFADKVIEIYESDDEETFTAYGKKEDWE